MTKFLKGCLALMIFSVIMLAILATGFIYVTKYKITEAGSEQAADGSYEVIFQQVGEPEFPFGATYVQVLVKSADGTLISREKHTIFDDGASFRPANWEVRWYPVGVEIVLKGSEQNAYSYFVCYDKEGGFQGYTPKQAVSVMKKRYGENVSFAGREEENFVFTAGEFTFQAKDDTLLTDNYEEMYLSHIAEKFSADYNRYVTFATKGEGSEKRYVPEITFYGRQAMEQEAFCNAVCDFVEYVQQDTYVAEKGITFSEIRYYVDNQLSIFPLNAYLESYDRTKLYNDLYVHLEKSSLAAYENGAGGTEEYTKEAWEESLTEEIWEYYLSIEPDCSYMMKAGTEYRMIGVDRAAGSSYYILISASSDDREYKLVNQDPYLGSGGQAMWLTFLEDERTGFSCLAYSGGAYGKLYRTEDGGKTFAEIEYPSPQVYLPDGTLYNPFVMPEEIYEREGKLYLVAGQGPDGDYYGEQGFCSGLYASEDGGIRWKYLGEQPVSRK